MDVYRVRKGKEGVRTSKINVFDEVLKRAPEVYKWLSKLPPQKIYISGPITGHKDYLEKFDIAEIYLVSAGHRVINPARLNLPFVDSMSYVEIMEICLEQLESADMVFFLEGWQFSRGAKIEHEYACDKAKVCVFEKKGE